MYLMPSSTGAAAQKQWSILRQSYCRELKKIPRTPSGSRCPSYKVKWQYFLAMDFLSDTLEPRNTATHTNLMIIEELDGTSTYDSGVNSRDANNEQDENYLSDPCPEHNPVLIPSPSTGKH